MKRMYITESQFKKLSEIEENRTLINQILKEELGVSDDVVNVTLEFIDKVRQELSKVKPINVNLSEFPNVYYREIRFNYKFWDIDTGCVVYHYNFPDNETCEEFKKRYPDLMFGSGRSGRHDISWGATDRVDIIQLFGATTYSIGNKFALNSFFDTLQHEISHFYEQYKRGKEYGIDNEYAIALTKRGSSNIKEREIAEVFYFSKQYEITAFENGMYAYLMGLHHKAEMKDVAQTELYQRAVDMKDFLNRLNKEEYEEYLLPYQISYENFLLLTKKVLKEMFRGVGRGFQKYYNDRIKPYFRTSYRQRTIELPSSSDNITID